MNRPCYEKTVNMAPDYLAHRDTNIKFRFSLLRKTLYASDSSLLKLLLKN